MNMVDQVVLITGGASGIGAAMAERFAKEGAWVVIADIEQERGEETSARLGNHVSFFQTDVSGETSFCSMIASAHQRFGRIDALINNAGISGPGGSIADISVEDFDRTMAVLLRGTFLGMKHVAPVMKQRGSGVIINIASVAGLIAGNGLHLYSAAKAGIIHLTRSVALELAEFGIRVNCICPGAIATPLFGKTAGLTTDESERSLPALKDLLKGMQPLGQVGLPEDIANAALWLASSESRFVTGQIIAVDGGVTAGSGWKQGKERRERIAEHLRTALARE
jgi:NAD(P)-dependent dehydrogenase (short-subunit alcohol dehydrogenase family)